MKFNIKKKFLKEKSKVLQLLKNKKIKYILQIILASIIGGLISFILTQKIFFKFNDIYNQQKNSNKKIHEIKIGENVSIPELIKSISPSIIQITNTTKNINLQNPANIGCGVIIDSINGYVITSYDIVQGNNDLIINFYNGESTKAKRLGGDPESDIALIQLQHKNNLKALKIGDSSKLEVGQIAIAIGCPLNFKLNSFASIGIINSLENAIPFYNNKTILPIIQSDTFVNQKNTGGPLVNSLGELIGINSIKLIKEKEKESNEKITYSIPSNKIKKIAEEIIKNGSFQKPTIGIKKLLEINDAMAKHYGIAKGILVGSIISRSSAEKANIKKGDIITKINNKQITSLNTYQKEINKYKKNNKIKITILRDKNILDRFLLVQ